MCRREALEKDMPESRESVRTRRRKRDVGESVGSVGIKETDFPARRDGTARLWDDFPRTPFGPNGASEI